MCVFQAAVECHHLCTGVFVCVCACRLYVRTCKMAGRGRSSDETRKRATSLVIVDVEKVKGLSNYYAYIIQVECTDGSNYVIYRRYRQFDEMHNNLEKRFPIEAGAIKAKDRTLPSLPGKKFFGRSAVRDVTDKRLPFLNEYLKNLMELPDKIRYDSIVVVFARATPEDMSRPYYGNKAYKSRPNGVTKPDRPERPPVRPTKPAKPDRPPLATTKPTIRLTPPSIPVPLPEPKKPQLLPKPTPPRKPVTTPLSSKGPRAKTLYPYKQQFSDELSFPADIEIPLVKRVDDEWWEGRYNGRVGLVPGNYIDVIQFPVTQDLKDRIQSSDEWDSSDDEDDNKGRLTYYFNGAARTMDMEQAIVRNPTIVSLLRAIQKHLHERDIVLNYKDPSGDLIEMVDRDDIELLKQDGAPPLRRIEGSGHAPWAIYVTKAGDNTPYNTDPYKR